jgi:hypothetical protein
VGELQALPSHPTSIVLTLLPPAPRPAPPRPTPPHLTPGDRKSGGTHILYDPTYSERGALLPVGRAPRAASSLDFTVPLLVKTPHALPMFRDEDGGGIGRKRGREPQKTVQGRRAGAARGARAHALSVPCLIERLGPSMPGVGPPIQTCAHVPCRLCGSTPHDRAVAYNPPPPQERAKALRPDLGPVGGAGRQGRIGTTGGTLLTQHLMRQRGGLVGVEEEMDPREAILRHAGKEDDISRLTAAYAKTQPKPIYAEPSDDEDGEDGGGDEGKA